MNIRLTANLAMATLLLIGSACSGMFAHDEKVAARATGGNGAAIDAVIGNPIRTAKE